MGVEGGGGGLRDLWGGGTREGPGEVDMSGGILWEICFFFIGFVLYWGCLLREQGMFCFVVSEVRILQVGILGVF